VGKSEIRKRFVYRKIPKKFDPENSKENPQHIKMVQSEIRMSFVYRKISKKAEL